MKYARILYEVARMPLAIMPEKLVAIRAFLADQAMGVKYTPEEIEARTATRYHAEGGIFAAAPGDAPQGTVIAVIPVVGTIAQRMDMLSEMSGGTSTERLARQLRAAIADPQVGSVVLNIDSPGGSVYGVPEVGAVIADAVKTGGKTIVAQVNSLAASAAYWIASQASEIAVTPSGEAGSIGVYTVHDDFSAQMEMLGVQRTYIFEGKYKVEANPFEPLSEEAAAALQARVADYYRMFTGAVAKGRSAALGRRLTASQVANGFGEGRVVGAEDAVALGMADRAATLDETLQRLAGNRRRRNRVAATLPAEDRAAAARDGILQASYEQALAEAREAEQAEQPDAAAHETETRPDIAIAAAARRRRLQLAAL